MHKNFGEWYRLVTLEPDGAKLQKRWAGVKAWASALRKSDENLLETVRIFQGIPSKTSRDTFLAAFQNQDPAFPQRNDLELQVLAGASLVACVQSGGGDGAGLHTAILAGTALEASSLRVTKPRLDEISREVLEGLQTLAAKQRERKPFDQSAVSEKADEADEALKQVAASGNWDQLKAAVSPEWVKVSERLPTIDDSDEGGNIWVWDGTDVHSIGWFNAVAKEVTHWMPNPRQQPPAPPEDK